MEDAFIWLIQQFGEQKIIRIKQLLPNVTDFPMKVDTSEQIAHELLVIIAKQMDVNPDHIKLIFFNEQLLEIQGDIGTTLFGQRYDNETSSAGLYKKVDTDNYVIALEIGQLREIDKAIATIAHEVSHIKILGEGTACNNAKRNGAI